MLAPTDIGLPYGVLPRRLLIWITTQAKIKRSQQIYLGSSQNVLLKNLGLPRTGGRRGSIASFRDQTKRLFSCSIQWIEEDEHGWATTPLPLLEHSKLLWQPLSGSAWTARIVLSRVFFDDIQLKAVPVDLRVLKAVSHYPLAIDVYCWLTHRLHNMGRPSFITWEQLESQFGNQFARAWHFKSNFVEAIDRISLVYPAARISIRPSGVLLHSGGGHVRSRQNTMPVSNPVNNGSYPR